MDVTKTHRIVNGLHLICIDGADMSVVFVRDREKQDFVRVSMADGRAYTVFTLGDFCEIFYAVQKEISRRHWDNSDSVEEVLAQVSAPVTVISG